MIRNFNYTGRRKIENSDIDITLLSEGAGEKEFDFQCNFEEYNFPAESKIVVEAFKKLHRMRFDFGTISNFKKPSSTRLYDLPTSQIPYFTIKVVNSDNGLLLGYNEKVFPNNIDDEELRNSLLPVDWSDLGARPYQVDFSENNPILYLNNKIDLLREKNYQSNLMVTMIYPSAFRNVLFHLVFNEELNRDEEWIENWISYIEGIISVEIISLDDGPSDLEKYEWIEKVVNEFCVQFDVKTRINNL